MAVPTQETIPNLLVKNLSRELILAVEEALSVGALRAFVAARGIDDGHLPHVVGQLRHFHMNESFHRALAATSASPSPIKGNGIVTGTSGVFTLARFNIPQGFWVNGRRSQTRRQMSMANMAIEKLVQPELFDNYHPLSEAVVFFVACFSGSLRVHPESPVSMQVAVPDRYMRGWLFRESLDAFVKRYDQKSVQRDLAVPKLRKGIGKQLGKDGTTQ